MNENEVEFDDPVLRARLQHFHRVNNPSVAERQADFDAIHTRLRRRFRWIAPLTLVGTSALGLALFAWWWPREPDPVVPPRVTTVHFSVTFHHDPQRPPVNITLRAHEQGDTP